ncbi:MAG: hypothetical protein ACO203_10275 [Steroidobacteraceae bacterium]
MDAADLEAAQDRIRSYFDAYLRGDSAVYAEQWVYPACVYSLGRWWAMADPETCIAANQEYQREALARGMIGGRLLELSARAEGRDTVWVDARFSREGSAGQVIDEVRAACLVVRDGPAWRVAVCVLRD